MIYTDKTKKALKLCFDAHKEQTDKSGLPYVFHPFHLAEQMTEEECVIVALLHDVVEDTDYTIDQLREMDFGDDVIEALECMTHEDGIPYMDYVRKIRSNPIASHVKLADLTHNSDLTRLNGKPNKWDHRRVKKYAKAMRILMDNNECRDIFRGGFADAIYGLAIGDALGVPYEFMERGSFECTEMTGNGTHDQPVGTWSDDTSMAIATAKSLKDNDGMVNIEDITDNFHLWADEDDFNANGYLFDIGHATMKALETSIPQAGEYSNGNGSLMRILPLAFVDCSDDEIRAVSAITHGHEISMQACVIYVHVARRLMAGETIQEIIPTLRYEKPFDRLNNIDQLNISDIKSGGYVVDTLEASLWALARNDNFKDTVLAAINLGDDTDTTGAVVGGLAGIVYGLGSDFAKACMALLRNKELIEECIGKRTVVAKSDWKTSDMPEKHDTFVLDRSFTHDQMSILQRGHIPEAMEDKWFWYMEGDTLFAHRSWTGYCIFKIEFAGDNQHQVAVNRDPEQYSSNSIDGDRKLLNKLLDWWVDAPYDYYNEWLSETVDTLKKAAIDSSDDPVLSLIKESGFEYVDKRDKGGCLWVIAGKEEGQELIEQCEQFGTKFQFSKKGSKKIGKPCWFTKNKENNII